jgi:FixJ family two-component response regulator
VLVTNVREARLPARPFISIIDDDEDVRVSIASLIDSLGFTIEAFPSAQDFLASDTMRHTHCLVADIHMPHMTGLELHRHLRRSGYSIPTILITAYPDDGVRNRALDQGVICYLTKPVEQNRLLRCIHSALERAKQDRSHS